MNHSLAEPLFFNPHNEIVISGGRLPHWEQAGKTYFITLRLADSLPAAKIRILNNEKALWLKKHPLPWDEETERSYHETFGRQIDLWLDAGSGSCLLRAPLCRDGLVKSLEHEDHRRYYLHGYVIMPNHLHVVCSLHSNSSLSFTISAWKSISARSINQSLKRKGTVWMSNYFDRLIRDQRHFRRCLRYLWSNPVKANLKDGAFTLYFAETVKQQHGDLFA